MHPVPSASINCSTKDRSEGTGFFLSKRETRVLMITQYEELPFPFREKRHLSDLYLYMQTHWNPIDALKSWNSH